MTEFELNHALSDRVGRLIRKYRDRCLWFLKEDFIPDTPESILRTLQYIERYGDMAAWNEIKDIKHCLLRNSNIKSAV